MDGICKLNGESVTWPCPTPACPLYGDCLVEWENTTDNRRRTPDGEREAD